MRAMDQYHKNRIINVFGNNEEKTLTQRIRDLNMIHHDLSPTNMVAYAQLPEQRFAQLRRESETDREAYINVTINENSHRNNNVFRPEKWEDWTYKLYRKKNSLFENCDEMTGEQTRKWLKHTLLIVVICYLI